MSPSLELLHDKIQKYPDFPKQGILFEDILPIFSDPSSFRILIELLSQHITEKHGKVDYIIGLEARGFLFGPALALELDAGFIPIRKKGKLPGEVYTATFEKEYGQDTFEIQRNAVRKDAKVVIVDDIIATGGSAVAAGDLVKQSHGVTVEYIFLMELDFLKGREKLDAPVFTLLTSQ